MKTFRLLVLFFNGIFSLGFVNSAWAAEPGVRLAVVSDPAFADQEAALTAVLSKQEGIALLERDELDKVLKEQTLQAAQINLADSLRVGKLLRADALVIIRPSGKDTKNAVVTLLTVGTSVILHMDIWKVEELNSAIPAMIRDHLPRLKIAPQDAIPLSIVPTEAAGEQALEAQALFQTSFVLRLSKEPSLFILERQKMEPILDEAFAGDQSQNPLWGGARIIQVEIGQDTMRPGIWIAVFKLKERSGKLLDQWQAENTNVSALVEPAAEQVLQHLKVAKSATVWDAKEEIQTFYDQFTKLKDKDFSSQAYGNQLCELAVTLYTLGNRDPVVWQYYAMHWLKESDPEDLFHKLTGTEWKAKPAEERTAILRRKAKAAIISLQQETDRLKRLAKVNRELSWETSQRDWLIWQTETTIGLDIDIDPPSRLPEIYELQKQFKQYEMTIIDIFGPGTKVGYLGDSQYWNLSPDEQITFYQSALEQGNYSERSGPDGLENWAGSPQYPGVSLWYDKAYDAKTNALFEDKMFTALTNWLNSSCLPLRVAANQLLYWKYNSRMDKPAADKSLVDALKLLNPDFATGKYSPDFKRIATEKLSTHAEKNYYTDLIQLSVDLLNKATKDEYAGTYIFPTSEADARQLYSALQAASSRLGNKIEPETQDRLLREFPQLQTKIESIPTVPFQLLWSGNDKSAFGMPDASDFYSTVISNPVSEHGKMFLVLEYEDHPTADEKSYSLAEIDLANGHCDLTPLPHDKKMMQSMGGAADLIYLDHEDIYVGPFYGVLQEGWAVLDRQSRKTDWFEFPIERQDGTRALKLIDHKLYRSLVMDFPKKGFGIEEIDVQNKKTRFFPCPNVVDEYISLDGCYDMQSDITGDALILAAHVSKNDPTYMVLNRKTETWSQGDEPTLFRAAQACAGERFDLTNIGTSSNASSFFGENLRNSVRLVLNGSQKSWNIAGMRPDSLKLVHERCDFSSGFSKIGPKENALLAKQDGNDGWLQTSCLREGVVIIVHTPWGDNWSHVFFAPWDKIPAISDDSSSQLLVGNGGVYKADLGLKLHQFIAPPLAANYFFDYKLFGEDSQTWVSWIEINGMQPIDRWALAPAQVKDVARLSKGGKEMWLLTPEGRVETLNASDGKQEAFVDLSMDKPVTFDLSPDGKRLALASKDSIILVDAGSKEIKREKMAKPFGVGQLVTSWSYDGAYFTTEDSWYHADIYRWTGTDLAFVKTLDSGHDFTWVPNSHDYLYSKGDKNEAGCQFCLGSIDNKDDKVLINKTRAVGVVMDAKDSCFFATATTPTSSASIVYRYDLKTFNREVVDFPKNFSIIGSLSQ